MPTIYKICSAELWREAERAGAFAGAPLDTRDGFIHFSTAQQVAETAAKHFAGATGQVLVAGRYPRMLGEALKWEPSRGGAPCSRISTPPCGSTLRSKWVRALPLRGRIALHVFPELSA